MKSDMVNMVTNNNTTEERSRCASFVASVVEEKNHIYHSSIIFIITITRGEDVTRN